MCEEMSEEIENQREEMEQKYVAINEIERGRSLIFLPCLPGIYTCLTL